MHLSINSFGLVVFILQNGISPAAQVLMVCHEALAGTVKGALHGLILELYSLVQQSIVRKPIFVNRHGAGLEGRVVMERWREVMDTNRRDGGLF
jgi:uncharacterized membrane protein